MKKYYRFKLNGLFGIKDNKNNIIMEAKYVLIFVYGDYFDIHSENGRIIRSSSGYLIYDFQNITYNSTIIINGENYVTLFPEFTNNVLIYYCENKEKDFNLNKEICLVIIENNQVRFEYYLKSKIENKYLYTVIKNIAKSYYD